MYIFRLKDYQPIVRPAILTGFLGYAFVVVGLLFDLGRPWRLPYPVAVSFGVTSVMFLVAWHVFLYLSCQFVEFSPALFEWLGWKRFRGQGSIPCRPALAYRSTTGREGGWETA